MKVAITNKNNHEWSAVCSQFGENYQPVETLEMNGITGPFRMSFFEIPSDGHFATWIRLVRPKWIDQNE